MDRHPGGEEHSLCMIGLAEAPPGSRWLDLGAGEGSTLRLLQSLGYGALGIDLEPRGEGVIRGDYLACPWQDGSFDAVLAQCSFYVGGDVPGVLGEAFRLLRSGGRLVFSDVTEDGDRLAEQCRDAGFAVLKRQDLTPMWREYYLEALWREDNVCLPMGKKFRYVLFVCEK